MITYLHSLSEILLISVLLRSLGVVLFYSFIWDVVLCLLILTFCVCFHVLEKSAMSLTLDASGLKKKRSLVHGNAVSPNPQDLVLQGVPLMCIS